MQIVDFYLRPLQGKHYSTDLEVTVLVDGHPYPMLISISGYAPQREKDEGWEPDCGIHFPESEFHLALANLIESTLESMSMKTLK